VNDGKATGLSTPMGAAIPIAPSKAFESLRAGQLLAALSASRSAFIFSASMNTL
jgi:hypothetical protein